jgi:hypothetical protein
MTMTSLPDLVDQPTAIVGATGSGKTFTAKGVVEELLRQHRRVVIIDPTGAWWGLRTSASGDPAGGFQVTIFGGDHADIAVTPDGGELVAAAIAQRDVQAIVDTSEMSQGEKHRFLTAFLETLYQKNRAPLHLIVDEADEVSPQNPMPEERRLSGIFDRIVRRGRIRGFRPLMITQRPAVLHKNVLSQIGTLVVLKLTSPQDRKAIDGWVAGNADADQAKEVMATLPKLHRGEGWVWSPAAGVLERTQFPLISTFDSSRTPDLDDVVVEPSLTAVDVAELAGAMRAADADHPPKAAGAVPDPAELEAAEERGYHRGFADGREHGMKAGIAEGVMIARNAIEAIAIDDEGRKAIEVRMPITAEMEAIVQAPDLLRSLSASGVNPPARPGKPPRPSTSAGGEAVTGQTDGERRLLLMIDPIEATPWEAVAVRAGYVHTGGGFRMARKRLIERGLVVEETGGVRRADPGAAVRVPTIAQLVEFWTAKIRPAAGTLLGLIPTDGSSITTSALAEQAGYAASGGGFRSALKALRNTGLVVQEAAAYRLSDAMLRAANQHQRTSA